MSDYTNAERQARWRDRQKAKIAALERTVRALRQHAIIMDSKTYRIILAGLHPDASKEMRDRARQQFEQYKDFVKD